jgi:hypothetical protein
MFIFEKKLTMKTFLFPFLTLAALSFLITFSACDDGPTPFEPPATKMYFSGTINNYEKAIVEGQNGYRYVTSDSCGVVSNGVNWFGSASIFQGNSNYFMSNRESFGLSYLNLFDTIMTNRDSVVYQYFNSPLQFAYIDTTTGIIDEHAHGVVIEWIDGRGDLYTTLYTLQTELFTFDVFSTGISAEGRSINIEGSFSCSLYSPRARKIMPLTDGITRISIKTACF